MKKVVNSPLSGMCQKEFFYMRTKHLVCFALFVLGVSADYLGRLKLAA